MAMMHVVWATCLLACFVAVHSTEWSNSSDVRIDAGVVRGVFLRSQINGRLFRAFMGIPYAKPPTGKLRFMRPQPVDHWTGIYNANRERIYCVQFGGSRAINDTEDCLMLNVYTPTSQSLLPDDDPLAYRERLPVIFAIHGGMFVTGTGSFAEFKPFQIMDYDVVFVAINYRLGPLGFLNTQDAAAPGNPGIYDQVLALQWVQNNIAKFGGDPNRVTIVGQSAGAVSVHYHVISPKSKGLFHAAIAESASPLNPWAYQRHPVVLSKKWAMLNNCTQKTTKDYVNCLRQKSVDQIFAARQAEVKIGTLPNIGPSIDYNYVPEDPRVRLSQGKINKVPMIIGYNKDEGAGMVQIINAIRKIKNGKDFLEKEFPYILSQFFDVPNSVKFQQKCKTLVERCYKRSNVNDPAVLQDGLVKIMGNALLIAGVSKAAEFYVNAGVKLQAYVYDFHIENGNNTPGTYVEHTQELYLFYMFNTGKKQPVPRTLDNVKMGELLDYSWLTFVINGGNLMQINTPNQKHFAWPFYEKKLKQYVTLNADPKIKRGDLSDDMYFWDNIILEIMKGE